jgi:hypothetical protein
LPHQREIVAELRRDAPDRARLAQLIDHNIDAMEEYARAVVDVMFKAHRVLRPEQRRAMAARAAEPSKAFEGSFWIDRAIDYLLLRLDASAEQRKWFERIELHLLDRSRRLSRQADSIRAEGAAEFAKDAPDRARIDAAIQRGLVTAREALIDVAGFYLLFASKLEPHQRAVLGTELGRFEPCRAPAKSGSARKESQGAPSRQEEVTAADQRDEVRHTL